MNKENIQKLNKKNRQDIITKLIYHSLEVTLAKALIRKSKKLKTEYENFFIYNSQSKSAIMQEIIIELQIKIDRHLRELLLLSEKLIKLNKLTTEIDIESIIPFKVEDIKKGYIKTSSANNTINEIDYYIILSTADILHKDNEELELLLRESYSQLPKGYNILLLT